MLTLERQRHIVDFLRDQGQAQVQELSRRFSVSPNTIRRDLRALEQNAIVQVVHGGAVLREAADIEVPFRSRETNAVSEKQWIGAAAARLVGEHEAILLDAGTTTHEVARALRAREDLTVVTNALNVAQELADCPGILTIVCGGIVRGKSNCLIGSMVERTLADWHVDKLFLSAGGIDLDIGVTNPNPLEVPIKQAMIRAARKVILVASSDKFGRASLTPIAPLSSVHTIVTDNRLPDAMAAALRALGIELILAGDNNDA